MRLKLRLKAIDSVKPTGFASQPGVEDHWAVVWNAQKLGGSHEYVSPTVRAVRFSLTFST
eukprot:410566-Pleurochrysis_carterae.AAC.1